MEPTGLVAAAHSLGEGKDFDDSEDEREGAPQAQAARGPAPPVFAATLRRAAPATPVGLNVDLSCGRVLHVANMKEGGPNPVAAYNAGVGEDRKVRAGDYIKAVNGVRQSAGAMAEALKANTVLVLEVQRPDVFIRKVTRRRHERMGLDLNYSERGSSLVITEVGSGALKRCAPDIQPGDRVVAVNGLTGTALNLLETIQRLDTMDLSISRCV